MRSRAACVTGSRRLPGSRTARATRKRSSWLGRRAAHARHQARARVPHRARHRAPARRPRRHRSRPHRRLRHRVHHLAPHPPKLLELGSDSPFMRSVERHRPAGSMRADVSRTLPHHSAIVVSNRAPHEPRPEGGFARGAGGVVTALLTLAEVTAADWVCCARNDAERKLVKEQGDTWTAPLIRSDARLHYVTPTRDQYEQYYSVISNPLLWFVQHYLWNLAEHPIINDRIHRAWRDGYIAVNRQIAEKVVAVGRQAQHRPLVLVHDYQLYLVPKIVRERLAGAIIQHFIHIPWPTPQYWKVLPMEMRSAILEGLLGCDIVGFQSSLGVRNFLMTCEENAGLQVDEREKAVLIDGRVVYARAYPISIDVASTTRLAFSH